MREVSDVLSNLVGMTDQLRSAGAGAAVSYPVVERAVHPGEGEIARGPAGARSKPVSGRGSVDRLLAAALEVLEALGSELQGDRDSALESVRRAGTTLDAVAPAGDSEATDSALDAQPSTGARGGLAPWQIRRLAIHIEANLHAAITTPALATLVRLSPFHFARAFKRSFGDSPHRYVLRRRMERAQGLMLTTDAPLGQIALDCGLADQSHLTRLFQRFVGESPAAWRRARVVGRG
jgi:AraC family transcriptional regulator